MCTIMTISADLFTSHGQALIERVRADARSNADGWSIVAYRDSDGTGTILKTTNLGTTLSMVPWLLTDNYDRIWLHARYATTDFKALTDTHAFSAGKYTVMHNGILRAEAAAKYRVDSQYIADLIDVVGLDSALKHLTETESYANCLIVDTEDGSYTVTKTFTGQLYTDGAGNYSSYPVATIDKPVTPGSYDHVAPLRFSLDAEVPRAHEDFVDWIYRNNYDDFMPDELWDALSPVQEGWLEDILYLDSRQPLRYGGI